MSGHRRRKSRPITHHLTLYGAGPGAFDTDRIVKEPGMVFGIIILVPAMPVKRSVQPKTPDHVPAFPERFENVGMKQLPDQIECSSLPRKAPADGSILVTQVVHRDNTHAAVRMLLHHRVPQRVLCFSARQRFMELVNQ